MPNSMPAWERGEALIAATRDQETLHDHTLIIVPNAAAVDGEVKAGGSPSILDSQAVVRLAHSFGWGQPLPNVYLR